MPASKKVGNLCSRATFNKLWSKSYVCQNKDVKLFLVRLRYHLCCVSVIMRPQGSHNGTQVFLSPRFALGAIWVWDPRCMTYLRNKKDFETGFFSTEVWASRHINRTPPLFSFETVQKNIRFTFNFPLRTKNIRFTFNFPLRTDFPTAASLRTVVRRFVNLD